MLTLTFLMRHRSHAIRTRAPLVAVASGWMPGSTHAGACGRGAGAAILAFDLGTTRNIPRAKYGGLRYVVLSLGLDVDREQLQYHGYDVRPKSCRGLLQYTDYSTPLLDVNFLTAATSPGEDEAFKFLIQHSKVVPVGSITCQVRWLSSHIFMYHTSDQRLLASMLGSP